MIMTGVIHIKIILLLLAFFFLPYVITYILPASLLWLFDSLKSFVSRLVHRKQRVFDNYGVHIFCGRVGCGKTISMIRKAQIIKRLYPNVKIYSNFNCAVSDGLVTSWRDIVDIENIDSNGVNQGVLFLFDELHLTLSSQGWRDAPENLLEYISLQRHLHKCIYGTTQVWSRVNKIIREQTDTVTECRCWLGKRLVTNRTYTQEDYQINGDKKDSGSRHRPVLWRESFVAYDSLRKLYDTDEIISSLHL